MQLAHYRMIKVQDMTHMNSLKYTHTLSNYYIQPRKLFVHFYICYHYIDTVQYILHAHDKIERHPRTLHNHRIDEKIN